MSGGNARPEEFSFPTSVKEFRFKEGADSIDWWRWIDGVDEFKQI